MMSIFDSIMQLSKPLENPDLTFFGIATGHCDYGDCLWSGIILSVLQTIRTNETRQQT
jgi:hypothetical protein